VHRERWGGENADNRKISKHNIRCISLGRKINWEGQEECSGEVGSALIMIVQTGLIEKLVLQT
jgi:hypothetical protein